jgi:hypothetical protein
MAHGSHGGAAPTTKPKVAPELAAFVSARLQPEDLPQIDAAMAQDEETKGFGALAQNLSRAASLYRGERAGPMAVQVPDALKQFVTRKQAAAAASPEAQAPNPDDDPASAVSQAARAALLQTPHGRAVRDSLGDSFEQLSASKLKPLLPMWRASADEKPPTRVKAADEPIDETDRAELTQRGINPAFARNHGEAQDLAQQHDARKAQREAASAAAGRQERRVGLAEEERKTKHEGQLYAGKFFKFGDDVPPGSIPDSQRASLIDETGQVADLAGTVDQLSGLYRQHGSQLTGPAAAKMRTLVNDIRLVAKSPAVFNLGVLNGPDLQILSGVIDDPTKLEGITKNAAALRDFSTELETFKSRVLGRITKRWESYGATPVGGPFARGGAPDLIGEAAALEGQPKRISSDAEYAALPVGAKYVAPDGSIRTKRGR